ncbi:MAG: protein kinase [Candidatus Hydrogenedentes bacterium]|nr:protein kinase [Candidatus Hydrogenedentota bacterium]
MEVANELSGVEYDRIGHYEIREKIAEGGFGIVYSAFDTRLKREVALKVLHSHHASEPTRVARFLREARSAARLQHPGIVQVHDVIEQDGRMALVMERVSGPTLDVYLKNHPNLTLEEKLEIAAKIAETLDVAHKAGIIHRDVKPTNVMIDENGQVKLSDFSLARLLDGSVTQLTGENNVLGTPAYMSPEQCEGLNAVPQSDLYSLGIMIYEMATGSLPFEAESYLALLRHHTDSPPTPVRLLKPSIPVALERLIMRCLAKKPEMRPASGAELARALRRIIRDGLRESAERQRTETVELSSEELAKLPPRRSSVHSVIREPSEPAPEPDVAEQQTFEEAVFQQAPAEEPPVEQAPAEQAPVAGTPIEQTPAEEAPVAHISAELPAAQEPAPAAEAGRKRGRSWKERIAAQGWPVKAAALGVAVVVVVGVLMVASPNAKDALPIGVPTILSDTPLLDYVQASDDNYMYMLHSEIAGEGYTAYVLDMTSQTWHADKVEPPVWRHWLTVIAPEKVSTGRALVVFAEGLSTADVPLSHVPKRLADIAVSSKSIVAIMEGFPRNPVGFHDETDQADEMGRDEFAVASFAQFLDSGDPTWPIVCPMVKSAVRAMDTIQRYAAEDLKIEQPIDGFVLTGAANGIVTWLTGAVDSRVVGIAPVGFDLLNIEKQVDHQVGLRGELSPFLSLFSESGVMPALESEQGEKLLAIIDPYHYRDRLTMPKLLLLPTSRNSLGTVDAPALYWNELKGDSYLFCAPGMPPCEGDPLLVGPSEGPGVEASATPAQGEPLWTTPRTALSPEHSAEDFQNTLRVFYHKLLVDKPMPKFTWEILDDGTFRVATEDEPAEVRLWLAESEGRDFQFETIGTSWYMERLKSKSHDGVYEGQIAQGKGRYRAFYIELVYPSKLGVNFSLTTRVMVLDPQELRKKLAALGGPVHERS